MAEVHVHILSPSNRRSTSGVVFEVVVCLVGMAEKRGDQPQSQQGSVTQNGGWYRHHPCSLPSPSLALPRAKGRLRCSPNHGPQLAVALGLPGVVSGGHQRETSVITNY